MIVSIVKFPLFATILSIFPTTLSPQDSSRSLNGIIPLLNEPLST